jgi:hypothetical protein
VRDLEAPSAQQRGHLAPPVQAFGPRPPVRGAARLAQGANHHRIGDRAGGDLPAGLLPRAVGPGGDLHALLAQDGADRLDREAPGSQLLDEGHDQRLRESVEVGPRRGSGPAASPFPRAASRVK